MTQRNAASLQSPDVPEVERCRSPVVLLRRSPVRRRQGSHGCDGWLYADGASRFSSNHNFWRRAPTRIAKPTRTDYVEPGAPARSRFLRWASSRIRARHTPRILFSHRQAPVGFDGACLVLRTTVGQDDRGCAKSRTARGILPRACSGARGGAQSHALTDRKLGDCAAIASADPVKPKRLARTAWRLS